MLLGGGHTARILAERLQQRGAFVTIVERKPERARELAERLEHCVILEGEITDADLLAEEEVGRQDVVIALTGEDDANILACLFAKAAGAKETVAVVHRLALLPLVHEAGIDVAISPRTAIANAVLRFARGGELSSVTTFLEGEGEIIELVVGEESARRRRRHRRAPVAEGRPRRRDRPGRQRRDRARPDEAARSATA